MDSYGIIISNLERLRKTYGLEYNEIDFRANLKAGTYENVINGKQILDVKGLIAISKLYSLTTTKVLSSKMRLPLFKDLPLEIRQIAEERTGKKIKNIEKRDIAYYCIIILNKHVNVGDDFVNSQIKGYLSEELKLVFKAKSIEWNKSIIAEYILDTETTRTAKTKPENLYRLVKKLPAKLVKEAKEIVGEDWLEKARKNIGEER